MRRDSLEDLSSVIVDESGHMTPKSPGKFFNPDVPTLKMLCLAVCPSWKLGKVPSLKSLCKKITGVTSDMMPPVQIITTPATRQTDSSEHFRKDNTPSPIRH